NGGRKPVDHGPYSHGNPPPLLGSLARKGLVYLFNQLAERLVLLLARFGIAIERHRVRTEHDLKIGRMADGEVDIGLAHGHDGIARFPRIGGSARERLSEP